MSLAELLRAVEQEAEAEIRRLEEANHREIQRYRDSVAAELEERQRARSGVRLSEVELASTELLTAAQSRARERVLRAQEGLLDRVFASAEQRLGELLREGDGEELWQAIFREVRGYLGAPPVRWRCSPEQVPRLRRHLGASEEIVPEAGLVGVRVEQLDGTYLVDATLDSLLQSERPRLAGSVLVLLEKLRAHEEPEP